MHRLHNGEKFPQLEFSATDGGQIILPDDLAGSYGVVLAYRGAWCPYCNEQLARFQSSLTEFATEDIRVVAFSSDPEEQARESVAKHHLVFPVGYGAGGQKVAEILGGFVNERRGSIEPMGFLLAPDSTIVVSVYSSGPIGRFVPEDILSYVKRLKSR